MRYPSSVSLALPYDRLFSSKDALDEDMEVWRGRCASAEGGALQHLAIDSRAASTAGADGIWVHLSAADRRRRLGRKGSSPADLRYVHNPASRAQVFDAVGMPSRPRPLPPDLPFAAFTTEEATGLDVSSARLRASDLRSVARGLWARRDLPLTELDIVAAYCRQDPAVFAAGLTAARLWKFPLPGALSEGVVEPVRPTGQRSGRSVFRPRGNSVDTRIHLATAGVRRRETALLRWSLLPAEPTLLGSDSGVRITSRIRTYLDLGSTLRQEALVAIGDHLVRQPRSRFEGRAEPFTTCVDLADAAMRFSGRGARTLRRAVDQVRTSSDSPAETRLRLAFVAAGLPEPLANVRISRPGEAAEGPCDLGEPDLHWPPWKVVVEHEGPHHLRAEQLARDISRGDRRRAAGWHEVRTTADDLSFGCRKAVARVRAALVAAGWRPT